MLSNICCLRHAFKYLLSQACFQILTPPASPPHLTQMLHLGPHCSKLFWIQRFHIVPLVFLFNFSLFRCDSISSTYPSKFKLASQPVIDTFTEPRFNKLLQSANILCFLMIGGGIFWHSVCQDDLGFLLLIYVLSCNHKNRESLEPNFHSWRSVWLTWHIHTHTWQKNPKIQFLYDKPVLDWLRPPPPFCKNQNQKFL